MGAQMLPEKSAISLWGGFRIFRQGEIRQLFRNFIRQKPYSVGVRKKRAAKPHARKRASTKWNLTGRETEVLGILRTGATDKDIARALGISRSTASKHVENILAKMGVTNRTGAASLSWRA